MFEILRFCDVENLQKNAASLIASCLSSALESRPIAVLAICGGRSVGAVFKFLAQKDIQWSRVHIFMADERCVPIDDPLSNFKLAMDSFLNQMIADGIISGKNVHPFVIKDDLDCAVDSYSQQLKEFGGGFDVSLLSIGEDGHIASLFPYRSGIKDIDSELFIKVDDSPKPPSLRISASRNLVNTSKCSVLLALGEDKRQALAAINDEVYDEVDCPAKLLKKIPCSYVLTDLEEVE